MEHTEVVNEPARALAEPDIACRTCGAEPKSRELLDWHQRGLYWTRSEREQLLCDSCFELLPVPDRREWIAVADLIVD